MPRRTAADLGAVPGQPGDDDLPLLTQHQLRIAQDVYDRFRALEGRSLFGSYAEGGLTARMHEVERQLAHGRLAPDTDQHALLGADAFKARLADQIRRNPDRAVDLLARSVPGALSYTFVFDPTHYAAGTWLVQDALQARRFQLLARKNSWNSPEHKRVVTMWHDPGSSLRFEVQFHTHASLEAQQLARSSAGLIADPMVPRAEAQTLRSDLAATWAALPPPPGNAAIGDYRRSPGTSPRS
jgi:hypothetical protein